MKQYRLLYIVREPYPTFRSDVATLFGKYLPRLGIHSDYVAERRAATAEAIPWGGGRALLCEGSASPLKRQWRKAVHGIRVMLHASRNGYAGIQVRDLAITSCMALMIGHIRGLPVFFWMSFPMCEAQIQRAGRSGSWGLSAFWYPLLQGSVGRLLLNKIVLKRADHIFVQSAYMRAQLAKSGVPATRLTAVPMGVDLEAMGSLQAIVKPALVPGAGVIVHLGVLEASRNSEMLLEVLSLVRERCPQAKLLCIGSAEPATYQEILDGMIKERRLEGAIRVTGWVSQDEAWRLAGSGNVGLSLIPEDPLYSGASPTKLIECLALGLPMVVNEHPDQRQVIEASGAGTCVAWSAGRIAACIVEILTNPDAWNEMHVRGPEYVRQYRSYERMAATVAARYKELLD